jgi:hypothetical protein
MLVSTAFDDGIGEQLPSLFLFDHVLVRAMLSGKSYYLDATDYGQRTLEELSMTMFSKGLPLRPRSTLERLVQGQLMAPVREVSLTWDASKEGEEKFPFEAKLTLRGSVAAAIRAKLAAATDAPALDTDLKNMVPGVENDDLSIIDKNPEMPDGSMVVNFKGTAAMDWSPYEGKRERRFSFTNGTINWDPDFDREKGPGKDWPVVLASRPYWERLTETVILPNGGKHFTVDATTLEQTVAGSTIKRSASLVGERAIAVSDFRHVQREITAEEARNAVPKLKDVRSDYAYVVGPPLPKSKKRR